MDLRTKLLRWDDPLVLYEVIPPFRSASRERVKRMAHHVRDLIADHPVDAVNVPEVRDESRNGERPASRFKPHLDPREFAAPLRAALGTDTEIVVNHPTVHDPPDAFGDWLDATIDDHRLRTLVLVGGESNAIDYPGPGPVAAARLSRERRGAEPVLGGITIPTRRTAGRRDEPRRLLDKALAGIEFFTSQVVYEAKSTVRLLADYGALCRDEGHAPRPILLSFAPITSRKDAKFLRWLGVEVPPQTESWILDGKEDATERSFTVAQNVLSEVLQEVDRRGIEVPVGINVEHVMQYNLEASAALLKRLTGVLHGESVPQRAA